MKYWYALIGLVFLIIVSSFVFSANLVTVEPTSITEKTATWLIENNLTSINKTEIKCNNYYCNSIVYGAGFYYPISTKILNDKNFEKLDVEIIKELDEKANQKINEYASNRIKVGTPTKSATRILREPTTQVIASKIDDKTGEVLSPVDAKPVDIKESCLILIPFLEWCIWK